MVRLGLIEIVPAVEQDNADQSLDNEANIDHVITKAPNTQLSATGCKLNLDADVPWDEPLILLLDEVYEAPMQPFPPNNEIVSKHGAIVKQPGCPSSENGTFVVRSETRSAKMRGSGFFFRPGESFRVSVYRDGDRDHESSHYASFELGDKVGEGELVLGDNVYVDSEAINYDQFKKVDKIKEWRYEFDQIGKEFEK